MKELIFEILEKLDNSDYIDPAEHLYDGIKVMKRHIRVGDDPSLYIHDFLWSMESDTVIDVDGVIVECIILLRTNMK